MLLEVKNWVQVIDFMQRLCFPLRDIRELPRKILFLFTVMENHANPVATQVQRYCDSRDFQQCTAPSLFFHEMVSQFTTHDVHSPRIIVGLDHAKATSMLAGDLPRKRVHSLCVACVLFIFFPHGVCLFSCLS